MNTSSCSLSDGVPYFEPDSYIIRAPDGNRAGFGALTNISGSGLIFCDVGGKRRPGVDAAR